MDKMNMQEEIGDNVYETHSLTNSGPGQVYLLLKIHNYRMPGRPIVSVIGYL